MNALTAEQAPDRGEYERLPARIAAVRAADAHRSAPSPNNPGAQDRSPVFLVGFPRSGTTLVEQILASHGAFVTSDEAPLIDSVLRLCDPEGRDAARGLRDLTAAGADELRACYWRETEARLPEFADGKRLVDKQPWNLVELPFIARLFPDARAIVMLRDPRDACLSAWMQYFALNPATLHLLTPEDTAAIYADMMDLWATWRDAPPLRAIELRYEDIVEDFDTAVGRLLEFLGVAWSDRVREFQSVSRRRMISTPSRDAVAQPIGRQAVGRWRNYRTELAPCLPALDRFVKLFGYPEDPEA